MQDSITSNIKSKRWRQSVVRHLRLAGCEKVAHAFENCGIAHKVDYCRKDIEHEPRVLNFTCHNRACPECEHRESVRKLRRYLEPLQRLHELGIPTHRLVALTLTTPFHLLNMTPELFKAAWDMVKLFLQTVFLEYYSQLEALTAAEKRRCRVSLRSHFLGALVASEFGGKNHHLHFHFIMYAPYLDQEWISEIWQWCTCGAAQVVYIEQIHGHDIIGAVQEVAKYVTKFTELPPDYVPHLLKVLKGSRRFSSYGWLYALKSENPQKLGCPVCGGERVQHHVMDYLEACVIRGVLADDEILLQFDPLYLVHLKTGNNSGEVDSENARVRDHPPPELRQSVEKWSGSR